MSRKAIEECEEIISKLSEAVDNLLLRLDREEEEEAAEETSITFHLLEYKSDRWCEIMQGSYRSILQVVRELHRNKLAFIVRINDYTVFQIKLYHSGNDSYSKNQDMTKFCSGIKHAYYLYDRS